MTNDATSALLGYSPSTDPIPIAISTQLTASGRVNISAAPAGSAPVYCNQVVIAVPVGSDAPSLYTGTPTGSASTGKWAVSTRLVKGSELWAQAPSDQDYAAFTYDCISANDYKIDYNLVFGVVGQVDQAVGAATVLIQETSGTGSDPSTFTPKQASLDIDKAWPQFYVTNLAATAPSSPTVPATDFANGAPIAFAWESNGTWFELFMSSQSAPVYAGTATTFTLSSGVSRETTFVLAASMTGSPGQDTPQGGYEPIVLYDALTITVSNPVLAPTSVAVSGTLSASGQTTLGAASAGALTAASATVTGALQAGGVSTGGNLNVGGASTLAATTASGLTVNGAATLGSASVSNGLGVSGLASLSAVNVGGALTARSAPVSMFGTGTLIAQGNSMGQTIPQTPVLAKTDGFAIAYVVTPGDNGKSSFGYGQIYTIGTWFQVLGGTVGSFGSGWSDQMDANPNAITIPVPANTYWYYGGYNWDGAQMSAPIYIYWFPIGGGSSVAEETFYIPSAEEAARLETPPPPPIPDVGALIERRESAAAEFVARLDEALARDLGENTKAELSELLLRM
jgi:hypothetical protein